MFPCSYWAKIWPTDVKPLVSLIPQVSDLQVNMILHILVKYPHFGHKKGRISCFGINGALVKYCNLELFCWNLACRCHPMVVNCIPSFSPPRYHYPTLFLIKHPILMQNCRITGHRWCTRNVCSPWPIDLKFGCQLSTYWCDLLSKFQPSTFI